MKKTFLAAVVGGLILLIWGFLAWLVLPLHESTMQNLPDEDIIVDILSKSIQNEAVYIFPGLPIDDSQAAMDEHIEKYKRGPRGIIVYNPRGGDPLMIGNFVVGAVLCIIAAFVVTWFLVRSTAVSSPYLVRVAYCGMFGVLITFSSYLSAWNWMGYPLSYSTAMAADAIIGWLLAGLGIAAIIKAPKETPV